MQTHFIYPIYTSILIVLLFVLVPRKEIRRLAFYGVLFGAVADVFFIILIGIIDLGKYLNFKYFGAFGIPFFPPVAWTAYFILYMYILPKAKPWKYLYPIVASCYSVFFSNVLQALDIIKWNYGNPILPWLFIYAPWHIGVTWAYFKFVHIPHFVLKQRGFRFIRKVELFTKKNKR
jgi:hypothetical protein